MRVIRNDSLAAEPADADKFTGPVWRSDIIEPADRSHLSGLRFVYAPGARSHWHIHEREQAIVAVLGHGLVAWEGLGEPLSLSPGDWWHVTPGVPHWHGAAPDAPFAHLAVTAGGSTTWLHAVSDEDYRSPHPRIPPA